MAAEPKSAATPSPPMQGRRLPDDSDIREADPGDYFRVTWLSTKNEWWFRDPFGDPGRVTQHTVTEHEDGTITVEPSIAPDPGAVGIGAMGRPERQFHGWLREGVWTW